MGPVRHPQQQGLAGGAGESFENSSLLDKKKKKINLRVCLFVCLFPFVFYVFSSIADQLLLKGEVGKSGMVCCPVGNRRSTAVTPFFFSLQVLCIGKNSS